MDVTLAPGTRLGPYEIVAPLGAGGMGEVYRARDTRLGREVAVKVLPGHVSSDPEVRARFEREARTVSSLNHPHICTLFDVGGVDDTDYLVMELLEGETLAARLARGPLPPADVLRLGAQIADALDQAHRAGVIHRDLKPGNVMLTRSGAKLLDFGLARATGTAGPVTGSGATKSPTAAAPLTAEGTIVGTFQYMAPEQLEGREADARTDLWALGCVLHEMATGRRAFEGSSQASLIAAIMHVQPAPISQVEPLAPPALDRVVSACLAKDPADRIQSAHDVKLQLGWIAEPGATAAGAAVATPVRRRRSVAPAAGLAVGALGILVAAVAGWALFARREPVVFTQLPAPSGLLVQPYLSTVAISPDGRRLVSSAQMRDSPAALWLWSLNSPDPVEIPGTTTAIMPVWSPDGRSLAYFDVANKGLFRVPLGRGAGSTRLCDASDPRGLSWGRRDVIVFAPSASGPLMKIPADGGTPEPATELDPSHHEAGHRFPSFLPDGEHFLFAAVPRGPQGFTIRVGSIHSRQSRVVTQAGSAAVWAPPGYLIFLDSGHLAAQRFDLRRLQVVGEKIAIGKGPRPGVLDAETPASASRNGCLAFLSKTSPNARLEWLDRAGLSLGVTGLPEGDWVVKSISPDGKSALATLGRDLYRVDLERAVSTRLLADVDPSELALWSPDGSRIVATSRDSGHERLVFLDAGGGGARDTVPAPSALFTEAECWAPDARSLLVALLGRLGQNADRSMSWDLWRVPLDGGTPKPWRATPGYERLAAMSPDGRWVACVSRTEGVTEIFIDSYPLPGRRVQVVSGPTQGPLFNNSLVWGRQGRELIYENQEEDLVSVPVERSGDRLRLGRLRRLFHVPPSVSSFTSRDGERFLVARRQLEASGRSIRLVQGWKGLVQR